MTNDETRMTNQTTMMNDETRDVRNRSGAAACFVIAFPSLIRPSDFVLRISPPRAVLMLVVSAISLAAGCSSLRSTQTQRDVYMNLMTPIQRAQFLHLEAADAPVSLRLAYLQEIGVYQQWAEQPKDIQRAILRRRVAEGMTPLQVQLAWGPPQDRRDETAPAEKSAGHTKIVWDYGLGTRKFGGTAYERSVCFLDGRALWVRGAR
jgi:hypothetical protein